MRTWFARRGFAKPSLPNIYKYGGTRINLKGLAGNYESLRQDIAARKCSSANLPLLAELYKKYVAIKYEIDTLIMRRREHEDYRKNFDHITDDATRGKLMKEHVGIARGFKSTLKEKQTALEGVEKEMMVPSVHSPPQRRDKRCTFRI